MHSNERSPNKFCWIYYHILQTSMTSSFIINKLIGNRGRRLDTFILLRMSESPLGPLGEFVLNNFCIFCYYINKYIYIFFFKFP